MRSPKLVNDIVFTPAGILFLWLHSTLPLVHANTPASTDGTFAQWFYGLVWIPGGLVLVIAGHHYIDELRARDSWRSRLQIFAVAFLAIIPILASSLIGITNLLMLCGAFPGLDATRHTYVQAGQFVWANMLKPLVGNIYPEAPLYDGIRHRNVVTEACAVLIRCLTIAAVGGITIPTLVGWTRPGKPEHPI